MIFMSYFDNKYIVEIISGNYTQKVNYTVCNYIIQSRIIIADDEESDEEEEGEEDVVPDDDDWKGGSHKGTGDINFLHFTIVLTTPLLQESKK